MPLIMLTLWIKLARNKLQSQKEEMIFQEICRFGSSTRKKVFKPQPQPHSALASYEQGIRRIPFICVLSFPLLGFSHLSFIWLRNIFMEMHYPHRTNCLFVSDLQKKVSPKEGESKKGYIREMNEAETWWSSASQSSSMDFLDPPMISSLSFHLYFCLLGSLTSFCCFSPEKKLKLLYLTTWMYTCKQSCQHCEITMAVVLFS